MKFTRIPLSGLLVSFSLFLTACSSGFSIEDKIIFEGEYGATGSLAIGEEPGGYAIYAPIDKQDAIWVGVGIDNTDGDHPFTINSLELTDKEGKIWNCPGFHMEVINWDGYNEYSNEFKLGNTIKLRPDLMKSTYMAGERGTSYVMCDSSLPEEFVSGRILGVERKAVAELKAK